MLGIDLVSGPGSASHSLSRSAAAARESIRTTSIETMNKPIMPIIQIRQILFNTFESIPHLTYIETCQLI